VTEEEKAPVKEQLEKLKETLKGEDVEAIKADSEELTKRFYAIAEKLYAQANPEGAQAQPDNNVYDADYQKVDDEGNN
ncbi:MAG: molecular chaperone DnaK, partial [Clostridia bacterium]|nr:molecular chaperone DnaK [Clostridia bacterium]